MKIAQISSVSVNNNKKTRQNSSRHQDLTSFGSTVTTTDSIATKEASDAMKSNFLNNISFKGHAEKLFTDNHSYGTSGLVSFDACLSDPQKEIRVHCYRGDCRDRELIYKSSFYHENSSIEKTGNRYVTNRVYFADPEEVVNEQTKKDHDYIVYDNYVDFPSLDEVKENYFNKEVDAKNFGQTFKNIAEFHYRREIADKKEIAKLQKEKENIQRDYDLSLDYKNTIDEKLKKFPWQVDTMKNDKEKADYFYNTNSEKLKDVNQKIGYYKGRIEYSQDRQTKAVQAFQIFDEVGLIFFDRDKARNIIKDRKHSIEIDERWKNEDIEKQKKHIEAKETLSEEVDALNSLIKVNNRKIQNIQKEFKKDDRNDNWGKKQDIKKIEEENKQITEKIYYLNDKISEEESDIQYYQKKIDERQNTIDNYKKTIPEQQKIFEQKTKEAQDKYTQMYEFYKQNIEN